MSHSVRRGLLTLPLTLAASLMSQTALAQNAVATAPKTYAADFFAAFNPVSAEDMVNRIPGFILDNGDQRRGFAGAAGNVLINGERPSSKTPLNEQLARISARDVLRIDLYAGGVEGADLRGQTMLVDVRLRPRDAGQSATNTFMAQAGLLDPSQTINPVFSATSAFRISGANLSLALQAQPARRGRSEFEKTLTAADGTLLETGDEFLQGDYWEYRLSGRASWKPSETDSLNINGQATPSKDGRHTYSETRNASGLLTRTDESKVTGDDAWAAEFGGDWERRLSASRSFKLIALASGKSSGSDERYTTRTAAGSRRDTLITRAARSGEYIGRGVYTIKPSPDRSIDFGAEAAFNMLESELAISVDTGSGPIPSNIPVADTRVEETRAEIYLADFWQVSPRLKIESGLTFETSRISQSGDASQERDFSYLKPRFNLSYAMEDDSQVRLLIERDVAQLDFSEFASAVSLFDGTVDLGNPNLEPERTWRAQIDWERRFAPKGVLSVSLFHDDVDGVQDQIPIAGQFDGPGNLGDGSRTGIRADMTAPLDFAGIPRGELRLTGQVQETEATDPATGLKRRLSGTPHWNYSIDFRQPVPDWKLLWGFLYERSDKTQLFRFKELRTNEWQQPNLDLFVETTAIAGLTIRFTAADILLPEDVRERRFFTPSRALAAAPSSIETRRATGAYGTRSYTLRVAGRF
jgi:outer membrane receptor protein involved in Fe transport